MGKTYDEILRPKKCPTQIDKNILAQIERINWAGLETAYGNAKDTVPKYLINLYCQNEEIAMDATHQLWCSLCHQHAFISSASIPAYDIIRNRLMDCDDKLKVELLDIMLGFARCSNHRTEDREYQELVSKLSKKILTDKELFEQYKSHSNEEIKGFSELIIEQIEEKEN